MGLQYRDLDRRTRELMVAEIDRDGTNLYLSKNLTPEGRAAYPDLLRAAAESGTDDTLAAEIQSRLNSHERARPTKKGNLSTPKMRSNAHSMLAEGEFNRFYLRALCLRALESKVHALIVYRAKDVSNPRSASEGMIGMELDPSQLLSDLRGSGGVDTALGLPPGPNSGLCAHLP